MKMSETKIEVKMLRVDQIRPNPFQPRESFPKEDIQQLARTIEEVGLLQPIAVRKKGETYQIISGERRWRASQFAGLKEIPAIIKDVSDSQLMVESLIENVQRADLEPIEKARGLAEVYRLAGFEPAKVQFQLKTISDALTRVERFRELSREEKKIKEVADRVGLSYDYQYRLLTQLRLTPEEQKRVTELKLGYEKIASISSIEEEEDRKKLIEIAPTLERAKVKTIAKIIKKAPKPVKEAVLKKEIEPEIAEEIIEIEKPEIQKQALEIAKTGVYTKEGFQTRLIQITRPRIELPEESIDMQIFNKTMWNLERVGTFDFYTIGYEKKTIEQFIELLKKAKIKTLVDARRNPVSQYKLDFDKEKLAGTLRKNEIEYVHHPELGVPSEIRRKLSETGDYNWFFKQYDETIIPKLNNKIDLDSLKRPIAIMCVELDPTKCHRHRIALALEERGLRSYDL